MGRLRDVIGNGMGMSGRTLDRYIRVLDAPREVQDAFRDGKISLVNASKAAGLSNEVQQQLATDLRSGTDPKLAVAARLEGRKPDPLDATSVHLFAAWNAMWRPWKTILVKFVHCTITTSVSLSDQGV